jgi:uncharacterized protein YutE (UPF0331/DUF86 family)
LTDDVLLGKALTIERCVRRIRLKYVGHEASFEADYDLQDIVIWNLQRACQAAIDMASRMLRLDGLEMPAYARDAFGLLAQHGSLPMHLADSMAAMVGFRNVAVHDYRRIDLAIAQALVENHLGDLLTFSRAMLQVGSRPGSD